MGTWGTAIFSDDLAADVRGEWRDHLGDGLTPEEATTRLLADYAASVADPDERSVFWLALAVAQWRTGRLLPDVRDHALAVIASDEDLARWDDPPARRARKAVLAKTKALLESPPPPAKRIPRRTRSETAFQPGDVVAYRHASGPYFVFWISGDQEDKGGHYSHAELLDFAGDHVPPLKELVRRPMRPDRAGFLLVHAARLPTDRYQVLGNARRKRGRARHELFVVDARKLDAALEPYLPI